MRALLLAWFLTGCAGCVSTPSPPDAAALEWGESYTFGTNGWLMIFNLVSRMARAGHQTAWDEGPWQWHDANGPTEKSRIFVFVTVDEDTARRAHDALERAGVLCHEPLGDVPLMDVPDGGPDNSP